MFLSGALVAIVLPVVVASCLLPQGLSNASDGESAIREFERFAAQTLLVQKLVLIRSGVGGTLSTAGVVYAIYALGRFWYRPASGI